MRAIIDSVRFGPTVSELSDGVAGERVDLADPLDFVAPELDPDRLLGVGREDLDRIAPDPVPS